MADAVPDSYFQLAGSFFARCIPGEAASQTAPEAATRLPPASESTENEYNVQHGNNAAQQLCNGMAHWSPQPRVTLTKLRTHAAAPSEPIKIRKQDYRAPRCRHRADTTRCKASALRCSRSPRRERTL